MSSNDTTTRRAITAPDAPAAIGPYSHAVQQGDLLFCSGMLPVAPDTGELLTGSFGEETAQCLRNLQAVCRAAGTELRSAVRLTIYTTDLGGFGEINDAYAEHFDGEPPARVTIGVAALPKGARVEIDAIVALSR